MKEFKGALINEFDRASAFLDLPKERQLKIINWIHMYFIPIKSCNYQVMIMRRANIATLIFLKLP